mgnify:CR=1 FL=1
MESRLQFRFTELLAAKRLVEERKAFLEASIIKHSGWRSLFNGKLTKKQEDYFYEEINKCYDSLTAISDKLMGQAPFIAHYVDTDFPTK